MATLLMLEPADALDAYVVVGGFPGVVTSWPRGMELRAFVDSALSDPTSPLVVMGERSFAAEFPPEAHPRRVLEAIGSNQRAFRAIGERAGVSDASLTQALNLLQTKGAITVEDPLSTRSARKLRRYRVTDPYLRFWLRFIGPQLPDLSRGRAELASRRLWSGWDAYRGLAVEPLVRDAVERLLPDPRFGQALRVGRWWSRAHDAEVDLVGVSEARPPQRVEFVGSIKWRDRAMFDGTDQRRLAEAATRVPGVDPGTRVVGVSRSGFTAVRLDVELGPEDLLSAWTAGV